MQDVCGVHMPDLPRFMTGPPDNRPLPGQDRSGGPTDRVREVGKHQSTDASETTSSATFDQVGNHCGPSDTGSPLLAISLSIHNGRCALDIG